MQNYRPLQSLTSYTCSVEKNTHRPGAAAAGGPLPTVRRQTVSYPLKRFVCESCSLLPSEEECPEKHDLSPLSQGHKHFNTLPPKCAKSLLGKRFKLWSDRAGVQTADVGSGGGVWRGQWTLWMISQCLRRGVWCGKRTC